MLPDCPIWKVHVPGERPFTLHIPCADEAQVLSLIEDFSGLADAPTLLPESERKFQWAQSRQPGHLAKEEFYGQIARQLDSGTDIIHALSLQGTENRSMHLKMAALLIAQALARGMEPAPAFALQSATFTTEELATIEAGFAAGKVAEAFHALARRAASNRTTSSALRKALMQPTATMFIAYVAILVIAFKLMPSLHAPFARLKTLPTVTKLLMQLSDVLVPYPWLAGLPLIFVIFLFVIRDEIFKAKWFSSIVDFIPVLGAFMRKGRMVNMVRTLAMLMRSGTPLPTAVGYARQSVYDARAKGALENVEMLLAEGSTASQAFLQFTLVVGKDSLDLLRAIKAGEKTGDLGRELDELANRMEHEYLERSLMIAKPIELVMTVALGALVGAIAYSIYIPLMDLGNAMSR
jgi:type II secretory pathway component PulF